MKGAQSSSAGSDSCIFRFGKANTFDQDDELYSKPTEDSCTTSETSAENKLIDRLGPSFFSSRQMKRGEISEKIQVSVTRLVYARHSLSLPISCTVGQGGV